MKQKIQFTSSPFLEGGVAVIGIIILVVLSLWSSGFSFTTFTTGTLAGQATEIACTDTDSGMIYTTQGSISGGTWLTTGKAYDQKTDSCKDAVSVYEYYCADATHGYYTTQSCEKKVGTGSVCADGVCSAATSSTSTLPSKVSTVPSKSSTLPSKSSSTTPTETSYSFSSELPVEVTSHGCEIADGALVIGKENGEYVDSCYIDIPVSKDTVNQQMIVLEEERANFFVDGDFDDISTDDIVFIEDEEDAEVTKNVGSWYSVATANAYKPAVENGKLEINKRGALSQIWNVLPGEEYELSYDVDLSSLGEKDGEDQQFYLSLYFYDADGNIVTFLNPTDDSEKEGITVLSAAYYTNKDNVKSEKLAIHAIDCEEYTKYNDGEGTYDGDVTFNQCKSTSGKQLTKENDIVYGEIAFLVNWDGEGTVTLDNVVLDYPKQVEVQLLNAKGKVVQSSTEEQFYVNEFSGVGTLRVYLRTANPALTPKLKTLTLGKNKEITATVGKKLATFTKPRLGYTASIAPSQDWYDEFAVRSLCLDYFNGNAEMNCWDFLVKYGVSRWRYNIPLDQIKTSLSETTTTYSFEFYDGVYDDQKEPVTELRHLAEAAEKGMEILLIIDANGEGVYWWGNNEYNAYWDDTGNLNDDYDPTSNDNTDDATQSIELMRQLTTWLVTEFDGAHSYMFSDKTEVSLPKINYWQVGVETNIVEPQWYDDLSDKEEADYLTTIAKAIKTVNSAAVIETSLNPYNSAIHQTFDYDYLENVLSKVDASYYTHFNFNMFNDGDEIRPEEWQDDYTLLQKESYFSKWKTKTLSVGAYDYLFNIYDPSCNIDDWERGFGMHKFSKLLARNVLSGLALPTEDLYDYLLFSSEGWGGRTLKYDDCWRSGGYMTNVFDRVSGTGILDAKDDPSQYELNEAGVVYFTIAKYLSTSSPSSVTIDDGYAATYLENPTGKYIVLWKVPTKKYAEDFMSYMGGYADEGEQGSQLVDMTLKGVSGITTATRIPLDGSSQKTLIVKDGVINGLLLEEDMPVIVKVG